jgi:hypothetical protein
VAASARTLARCRHGCTATGRFGRRATDVTPRFCWRFTTACRVNAPMLERRFSNRVLLCGSYRGPPDMPGNKAVCKDAVYSLNCIAKQQPTKAENCHDRTTNRAASTVSATLTLAPTNQPSLTPGRGPCKHYRSISDIQTAYSQRRAVRKYLSWVPPRFTRIRSTSSRLISSCRRSYSWVVRVDA